MTSMEESSAFVNTSPFSHSLFKGLRCGADTSGGEGTFLVNPAVLSVWAEGSRVGSRDSAGPGLPESVLRREELLVLHTMCCCSS